MTSAADPSGNAGATPVPGETRALLRILASQSANANPMVALAALVLIFTLYGRVDTGGLLIWAGLAITMGLSRHLVSRRIRARLDAAAGPRVRRDLSRNRFSEGSRVEQPRHIARPVIPPGVLIGQRYLNGARVDALAPQGGER